jgi:CO dehydrogenase/acetyl-CoA synthase beta subunit
VNINRKVFLYGASKWLALKEFIPCNLEDKITVADQKLKDKLLELVKKSRDPIVLVWLGTCELTEKKGNILA